MNKEFIPYEIALELKKLGFDSGKFLSLIFVDDENRFFNPNGWIPGNAIWTPTFSQAFRFFREKYSYHHSIYYHKSSKFECRIADTNDNNLSDELFGNMYLTYEEAELECLRELIEYAKTN